MGVNIDFRQVYDLLLIVAAQRRQHLIEVVLGKLPGEPDKQAAILITCKECYFFQALPAFFGQQL